jgi:hypothetical protein
MMKMNKILGILLAVCFLMSVTVAAVSAEPMKQVTENKKVDLHKGEKKDEKKDEKKVFDKRDDKKGKLVHRFLIDDIISYNNPTRNLFFLF